MAFSATETSLVLSPCNPRSLFIIVAVNVGTKVALRKRILLHGGRGVFCKTVTTFDLAEEAGAPK
jgi:hypothetical protein